MDLKWAVLGWWRAVESMGLTGTSKPIRGRITLILEESNWTDGSGVILRYPY